VQGTLFYINKGLYNLIYYEPSIFFYFFIETNLYINLSEVSTITIHGQSRSHFYDVNKCTLNNYLSCINN